MILLKIRRSSLICSARHAASNSRKTNCWDPIRVAVCRRSRRECRYEHVCFSDLTSHLIGGCSGSGFFSGFWVVASFAFSRGSRRSVLIFRVVVVLRASSCWVTQSCPEDRKEKISNILNQIDGEHQGRQIRWFFGFRDDRIWVGWCLSSIEVT